MPLFVLHCVDKPHALEVRMGAREAHLAYVGGKRDILKLGGPMLDANGDMAGSLLIVDVADKAAAEAFSADDPYTKAGLWQRVDITAFKATLGHL
ncbi:YciI family protein [Phenylobacterium sp.]|uniref:YciI family protein n=1 Tax=Phenylobacterium sp. TaxID=1871053 RepID=UPI002ED83FBB